MYLKSVKNKGQGGGGRESEVHKHNPKLSDMKNPKKNILNFVTFQKFFILKSNFGSQYVKTLHALLFSQTLVNLNIVKGKNK